MEYDYDVYLLSQKFISDYPLATYPELMYARKYQFSTLPYFHDILKISVNELLSGEIIMSESYDKRAEDNR